MNQQNPELKIELDSNSSFTDKSAVIVYQIMHMEKTVAEISATGAAKIMNEQFMPYDLYFDGEEAEFDIDTRMNNLNNFYHWCASRVLSLDRKYAKEI